MAVVLAMVISLAIEAAVKPYVSVRIKATITLVAFFSAAYLARRQLLRLRDGGD